MLTNRHADKIRIQNHRAQLILGMNLRHTFDLIRKNIIPPTKQKIDNGVFRDAYREHLLSHCIETSTQYIQATDQWYVIYKDVSNPVDAIMLIYMLVHKQSKDSVVKLDRIIRVKSFETIVLHRGMTALDIIDRYRNKLDFNRAYFHEDLTTHEFVPCSGISSLIGEYADHIRTEKTEYGYQHHATFGNIERWYYDAPCRNAQCLIWTKPSDESSDWVMDSGQLHLIQNFVSTRHADEQMAEYAFLYVAGESEVGELQEAYSSNSGFLGDLYRAALSEDNTSEKRVELWGPEFSDNTNQYVLKVARNPDRRQEYDALKPLIRFPGR